MSRSPDRRILYRIAVGLVLLVFWPLTVLALFLWAFRVLVDEIEDRIDNHRIKRKLEIARQPEKKTG